MAANLPESTDPLGNRTDVFLAYLDFFRERILDRVAALPDDELHRSRLPSGWTPLELIRHVTFVERRWLEWGFEGRDVGDPWGDRHDDRWHVGPDEPAQAVLDALRAQGIRSSTVIRSHDLTEVGQPGPRWDGATPPALERVLFHLLQEYARHAGQLDVVVELAGGAPGE